MTARADLLSTDEAAAVLGVTAQQVRRLVETGEIDRIARGLLDRGSVERYLTSARGGRTRVWAEHTAWGAIALLSGLPAPWLTSSQASRVRSALRAIRGPHELVVRTRGRATVQIYAGDATAAQVLHELVRNYDRPATLLVGTRPNDVDGYLAADELPRIARILRLRPDPAGPITLRATTFDINHIRELAETGPVLAALDASSALNPKERAAGEHILSKYLHRAATELSGTPR